MKYIFCPKCGGQLGEMEKEGHPRLQCQSCRFIFYQNSKPSAGVLILDGNKILLGKRKRDPFQGHWDVIGGFLEEGEHPEDGARREAKEETGVDVETGELLGIFIDTYGGEFSTLNIFYIAAIKGGTPVANDDIAELRWYDVNELPENIAFHSGRQILEKLKTRLGK